MKVLKIAFGHPDNVLSLGLHLSKKVDLTIIFVVYGETYQQGVLNIDLHNLPCGLHTDGNVFEELFPASIVRYMNNQCRVWILKTPSLKLANLRSFRIYWCAIKLLKKYKFDVIHYNGFSPYIYLFYQSFKKGPAQFWTLHDYKSHSGEKNIKIEKLNQMVASLPRLTIIQHYEYLRRKVIEVFELPDSKVKALLSGPLDIFHSFSAKDNLCPKGDYILFFGRISSYKGIDILLKAFQTIPSPKPQLVVAGKGSFWFDITPYKKEADIHFFNEYIENDELIGLIQQSQFIVVPYRDATHSAVIATAYAMNKPVIASDVDGLKEVVHDGITGRLVEPGSSASLQEALEEVIRCPDLLDDYVENIKNEKESGKIAWDRIVEQYLALYTEKQITL